MTHRKSIAAAVALMLAASPALAGGNTPFAIDFSQKLKDIRGDFFPGSNCIAEQGKPTPVPGKTCDAATLGDIAVAALLAPLQSDQNLSPTDKFKHAELARKIYDKTGVVLSSEDISTIKDRIGKAYAAAVVGAAWPLLDPSLMEGVK